MNPSKETIAANPDGTARLQSENVSDKSRISKAEAERDALEQKNKLLMESRNGDELSPEGNIQNLNIAEFPDPSKSVPTLEAMQIMAMQDALHEMWDTLPGHEGEHYECAMCGAVMYSCMDYTHNEDCPYEIGFNALDAFYDAWEKASANAAEPDKKPDTESTISEEKHNKNAELSQEESGQNTGAEDGEAIWWAKLRATCGPLFACSLFEPEPDKKPDTITPETGMGCGRKTHLSCDHIIAVTSGGETILENLRTLCLPCNIKKGARNGGAASC